MAQTKEGAAKAMATIRANHGVTADGRSVAHVRAGREGGRIGGGKGGFAVMDPERLREVSRKGGHGGAGKTKIRTLKNSASQA